MRNPFFAMVQRRYATIKPFRERDIPCVTVEGLLLLKLYALPALYRQGNFARVGLYENDIATLMYNYRPDLRPLFTELTRYLSGSDVATPQDIVAEIRQRIERFQQGFGESPLRTEYDPGGDPPSRPIPHPPSVESSDLLYEVVDGHIVEKEPIGAYEILLGSFNT
jgi:hypothetical protein